MTDQLILTSGWILAFAFGAALWWALARINRKEKEATAEITKASGLLRSRDALIDELKAAKENDAKEMNKLRDSLAGQIKGSQRLNEKLKSANESLASYAKVNETLTGQIKGLKRKLAKLTAEREPTVHEPELATWKEAREFAQTAALGDIVIYKSVRYTVCSAIKTLEREEKENEG